MATQPCYPHSEQDVRCPSLGMMECQETVPSKRGKLQTDIGQSLGSSFESLRLGMGLSLCRLLNHLFLLDYKERLSLCLKNREAVWRVYPVFIAKHHKDLQTPLTSKDTQILKLVVPS